MVDQDAVLIALALAKRGEGFCAHPYLCPAGVPTIGFGFTRHADGSRVKLTDPPMTREDANALLELLIRTKYMRSVMLLCPHIDTPGRLGALSDFQFNTGALRSSTLRQRVNAGLWDQVPAQLRRWNKGGGRVLKGLSLRREAEIVYL